MSCLCHLTCCTSASKRHTCSASPGARLSRSPRVEVDYIYVSTRKSVANNIRTSTRVVSMRWWFCYSHAHIVRVFVTCCASYLASTIPLNSLSKNKTICCTNYKHTHTHTQNDSVSRVALLFTEFLLTLWMVIFYWDWKYSCS